MIQVSSSIGTVLERIIKERTGLATTCKECKDDIALLNAMAPDEVLAKIHKHAGRIVNRAMSRRQPWYLRLTAKHAPKLATAVVSGWITEACDLHTNGTYPIVETVVPDVTGESRQSLEAGQIPEVLPTPGRYKGQCIAVTSLSPNPKKLDRQIRCVKSWHAFGLDAIAVNTATELAKIGDTLRSIVTPVESNATSAIFGRRTQTLSALIAAGIESQTTFMVINSDVELYGDRTAIDEALTMPDRLTLGVRWNHSRPDDRHTARLEQNGIDAFVMTPTLASELPQTEFAIGMPVWDYWLPHAIKAKGHPLNWIKRPLLFHQYHPLNWSWKDWATGVQLMQREYGIDISRTVPRFRDWLETH